MSGQRMIQPRDCGGLTANARESGIRTPSRGTHPLPGQVIAGNASDRHPKRTHPAAIVVGTESQPVRSHAIPGHASGRRRGLQRCGGTLSATSQVAGDTIGAISVVYVV
jgi:hypothetical protein